MINAIKQEIESILSEVVGPVQSRSVVFSDYVYIGAMHILINDYRVNFLNPIYKDIEPRSDYSETIDSSYYPIPKQKNCIVEIRNIIRPNEEKQLLFVTKFGIDAVPPELRK